MVKQIQYRKNILALIMVLFVTVVVSAQVTDTIVSVTPTNRNILLEEYTGSTCVYCPDGHRMANELAAAYPGRVNVINIYDGPYTNNIYTTQFGSALANQSDLTFYPSATINRHVFSGSITSLSRYDWADCANQIMSMPSPVNIAAEGTMDWTTRTVNIRVQLYYTADQTITSNALNIAIIQDDVLGSQTGGSTYDPDQMVGDQYTHQHILRHLITGQWGETINTISQGTLVERTYEYEIPEQLGFPNPIAAFLENLRFIAFVCEGHQEVLTSIEIPVQHVNVPAIGGQIVSVKEIQNFECNEHGGAYFEFKNNGSDSVTSLTYTYLVNNTAIQNIVWNGIIPSMNKDTIHIPVFDLNLNTDNAVVVQVTAINGENVNVDSKSLTITKNVYSAGGRMVFKLATDFYASETSFNIIDPNGDTVLSGGHWPNLTNNGTYVRAFNFFPQTVGCYRLEVYDTYGDGINSGYGAGYFQLLAEDGSQIFLNDGHFTHKVSYLIDVTASATFDEDFNIVYVTPTGSGNHSGDSWTNATSSISFALIKAMAYHADVWVAAGIYYGDTASENAVTMVDGVNVYGGFLGNESEDYNLSLRDFVTNTSILDGQSTRQVLYQPFPFTSQTTWDGFTIQHGWSTYYYGGGVSLNQNGYLSHCIIKNNYASAGGGVYAGYNSTVSNCLVSNNTADGWGGGVLASGATISNSTIVRNSANSGAGIYGYSFSNLTNSIVWGNESDTSQDVMGYLSCSYSALEGGGEGEYNIFLSDEINQNPLFINPSLVAGISDTTMNVDWHLQDGSVCINHGNNMAVTDSVDLDGMVRILRDTVDLGCFESDYNSSPIIIPIVYVAENGFGSKTGESWENAMASIQDAIALAKTRIGIVWVAAGTYFGDTTAANAFNIIEGVNVYGGFVGNEPAEYDLSLRDFKANATILDGLNARRVLYQPSSFNTLTSWDGFTIQNGQTAGYYGSGGGAYLNGNGKLCHCIIKDNTAYYGGGVYAYNSEVSNCLISNNTANGDGGGVYAYYSSTSISNCLISNNTATSYGGGVYNYYATIANSTIVHNTANNGSGVYSSLGGNIINSVVWGNGTDENNNMSGTVACSYSAVEGGAENGEHVINLNSANSGSASEVYYPWFVSPDNGDFRLHHRSCLINAGTNLNNLPTTDLSNLSRVYDDTVDIGCYEFHGEAYCATPVSLTVQDVTSSAAMLTWDNHDPDGSLIYELSYKLEDDDEWIVIDSIQTEYYLLTGLQSLTPYAVRVRTICDEDVSSHYSAINHFSTQCSSGSEMITIGETTSSNSGGVIPTNIYYNYSYTQQIYQAAEIDGAKSINGISFQYFYATEETRNIDVYLGHTQKSAFSNNSDWIPLNNLTLVYSGNITFNNLGEDYWMEIPLNTVFDYNGEDNLVLVVDDNTGSWTSSASRFYTHSTSGSSSLYVCSDGTNYNPANPSSGNSISYRNNLRLSTTCIEDSCVRTVLTAVTDITDSSALLVFTFENGVSNFEMEFKEESDDYYMSLSPSDSIYVLTGLRQNTRYEVRTRTVCDEGYSHWKRLLFTTGVINYDHIYVTQNGTGDGGSWTTATSNLQWALNTAREIRNTYGTESEVWMAKGIYYGDTKSENAFSMVEGVNVYGGFEGYESVTYDLSLRDFETHTSILDGQNTRRVIYQPSSFNKETTWDGFTIQNGQTTGSGGGSYLRDKGKLSHCVIKNNTAYSGGGVYAYYNSIVSNCMILNNNASYDGGVYAYYSTVSNCLISNNTASNTAGGVYSSYATITNSTVVRNKANLGSGVYASGGSISNSIIWGNGTDELNNMVGNTTCSYSAVEGGFAGDGNILLSDSLQQTPLFVHASLTSGASDSTSNVDWHLQQGSVCVNKGDNAVVTDSLDLGGTTRVKNDTVDMGCYESDFYSSPTIDLNYSNIVYVTQNGSGTQTGENWDNATSSLSFALSVARTYNADVWVAAGTYYGNTASENAFVMVEGVDVFGGFAGNEPANYDLSLRNFDTHATILDGQNTRRVLYQTSSFNTLTTWDGFTIQNGRKADYYGSGGGVYLNGNGKLSHCVIRNNLAYSGGGVYASNSTSVVSNCLITNNTASSYGGGVYASSAKVLNCKITNNTANSYGGGVYAIYSSTKVSNCLVSNNTANNSGGGVYCYSATITNSTIVRNIANNGAGVYGSSGGNLTNCIVWGNGMDVSKNISGFITCSYSAVEGGFTGEQNILLSDYIQQTPQFVHPSLVYGANDTTSNVDWHLQQGSPCINVGDNTVVTDSFDLDGTARIKRDTVDMGCYESDYYSGSENDPTVVTFNGIIYVTQTGAGNHMGNSWGNAISSLDTAQVLALAHNAVVWVAAGVYYGNTDSTSENAFTMVDGVNVYGGFAGDEPGDYDLSLRDFEVNETILDGDSARRVLYQPYEFNTRTTWDGFTIQNGNTNYYYEQSYDGDDGFGGGAYLTENGVLSHCVVKNNVGVLGGGIFAQNNSNISYCLISDNMTYNSGGGVCIGLNAMLSRSVIQNNDAYDGGGVYVYESTVLDCQIIHNNAETGGGVSASSSIISNCLISNNDGSGLSVDASTVSNSTIVRNTASSGSGILSFGNNSLINCIVWGNGTNMYDNIFGEISCSYSAIEGGYAGDNIIVLDDINSPVFVNPSLAAGATDSTENVDWHLQQGSVCINRGDNSVVMDSLDLDGSTRIMRDTVDLGCYESGYYSSPLTPVDYPDYSSIIYVTESGSGTKTGENWANATASIQHALALGQMYHADVWVAAGTYFGDTSVTAENAFIMRGGVNVYGGFAGNEPEDYDLSLRNFETNTSILDGQNVRRVVCQYYSSNTQTIWDGFTIQNGQSDNGGGACIGENGVLSHCDIKNNKAFCGGGVYAGYGSTISNCHILNNTVSGDALGGGIYASKSTILSCTISNNTSSYRGGGICVENYYSGEDYSTISNCIISNNTTSQCGGGVYASRTNIFNCLVSNNVANSLFGNSGGGVYAFNTNISNSTIVRNAATTGAGISANYNGSNLTNCIVWGNGSSANDNIAGNFNCFYSAVEGGYTGEEIIALDGLCNRPMFVNPSLIAGTSDSTPNIDWHLLDGSVCINGGNNSAVTDSLDLDGMMRIKRDTIDLGCFESDFYGNRTNPLPVVSTNLVTDISGTSAMCGGTVMVECGSPVIARGVCWSTLPNPTLSDPHTIDSLGLGGFTSTLEGLSEVTTYYVRAYATNSRGTSYGEERVFTTLVDYHGIVYVIPAGSGTHSGNTWANATSSIDTAQALAQTYNAVVWVAAGTYYGDTTSTNAFTMRDGVSVYGGFAGNESADYDLSLRDFVTNVTILDGQNKRQVLYQPNYFIKEATWDGFTLQNGRASYYGGGANLERNGKLSHCVVKNNTAYYSGGGIHAFNATIESCVIDSNTSRYSGGGMYVSGTVVDACIISNNTTTGFSYDGGGVCAYSTTISNCDIFNNTAKGSGGGVYAETSDLFNCLIYRNVSQRSDADSYGGGGVCLSSSTMAACQIGSNTAFASGGGVNARYSTVRNCLVAQNTANSYAGGMYLNSSSVYNSTIVRNRSNNEDGGVKGTSSASSITNSIVWGNVASSGFNGNVSGNTTCSYSSIEDGCQGDSIIVLNAANQPLFVNPSLTAGASDSTANVDWHLQQGSPCINRGDNLVVIDSLDLDGTARIKRDTVDLGCYESDYYSVPVTEYDSIIYVTVMGSGTHSGNSWANATSSIEEAQALAITYGAVVWVSVGTYYGDTTASNAFAMRDGVNVYGGFAGNELADFDLSQRDFVANATILDGQNARRVLYQPSNFNDTTKWDGFVIQHGQTSGDGAGAYLQKRGQLSHCIIQNNTSTNGKGGGIYCSYSSVKDCGVVGNTCYNRGGGIYASSSTVSDCKIEGNSTTYNYSNNGGGGVYASSSAVTGCQITSNTSAYYGGGVYLTSNSSLRECMIADNISNYAGGVYVTNSTVLFCEISHNQSSYSGGGMVISSNAQVRNSLVDNNTAGTSSSNYGGGGISGNGTVVNTTVVRNKATGDGAGINGNTSTTLRNCIVWGNKRNGESNSLNGNSIVCLNSAIEGGYSDESVIVLNESNPPMFINPSLVAGSSDSTSNVDWHLQDGSVCVNRGDNSFVTDSLDLDGTVRIKRDTVDLGCYESDYYSVPVSKYDSIIYVTITGAGTHSGNSWANAISSIEDAQGLALTYKAVVWVAAGTYYGDTLSDNAFTMHDGVNVYGGFAGNEPADYDLSLRDFEANETVLEGDSSRRVLYQPSSFNSHTSWDGFTIQNGQTSNNGGGAYLQNKGVLTHCKVEGCIAGIGGGVYCSSGTVSSCVVSECTANNGGGMYSTVGDISECVISGCMAGNGGGVNCTNSTVSSCTITDNKVTGNGGGFYSYNSTIVDCDIMGNESSGSGGGVYCYYTTGWIDFNVLPTKIIRCKIIGNHSYNSGGGACLGFGDDIINSCLISNNTSNTTGGGVSGKGHLNNVTIVRNYSTGEGGGLNAGSYNSYYPNIMALSNCVVWGNESNGGTNNIEGGGNVFTCSYSAIEGGYSGTGNILLDETNQPHFVNPSHTAGFYDSTANVDWHLQNGSVCINRGDNSAVTDSLDLGGMARIKRDTVDMGCYESDYYSVPMTEYDSIIYVTVAGAGSHSGNSWENAMSSIADAQVLALTYNAVVWVAAGTYYGDTTSTSNNAFTMVDGVNVYGGFAGNEPADYDLSLRDFEVNETVLDGQDVRRILLQPNGFDAKAKWNGFTLRNGRISGNGGGAYLMSNGDLNQCKVIACMAGSGGGVYSSGGSVTECTITNCTAGNGGGVNCTGNSTVSSSTISDNTATSSGGGVYSYGSNIVDCDIIRNEASNYGGGIYCYYFAGLFFDVDATNMLRCRISGNYSGNNGGGVCMGYGNDKLKSCLISNNTSNTTGGGVHGNGSLYNTTVVRNSSVSNGAGVVGLSNGYGTSLSNCIVWGNEASGVRSNVTGSVVNYSAIEGGYGGTDNIMLSDTNQPFFVAPSLTAGYSDSTENVDWHLQQSSPCINRGNDAAVVDELDLDGTARIKRDTVDMGCYESDYYSVPVIEYDSIIYVTVTGAGTHSGNSWENAISSLSEAQALAKTYDAVVWVAAGTYYGDTTSTSNNAFSMVDGVCVYGGFVGNEPANYDLSLRDLETNETVLDGQNERRVLLQPSGYGTRTIWDGFTLRNGHTSGYGGGAYLRNNGVLNQCEVKDCAAGSGGGVYSIGGSVTECAITNCTAGNGGGVNCTGNTTISSSIIADNIATSSGGGLYSYNSTFIDCDITGNEASGYGGGVYCYYFASVISYEVAPTNLIRCRISRNHSANSGGGICMGYGNDKAKDCLISNNTSNTTGGGVSGNGSLLNTTVVHNQSTGNGAGVNGGFSLLNSIVWGNRRLGLKDNLYGGISCSYSAIEGGYVGEGNVTLESSNMGIGASPCFVSPTFGAGVAYDNGDWHLSQNSACVNVGSLDSTLLSETDLDGNPRMQYGRVDMGCYEFQNTQIVDSVNVIVLSDNVMRGSAVGGGLYNTGDTVLLRAVPSQYAQFLRWSDNDTTNPRYVIAERDTTFVAIFDLYLPELHVTSISHSELVGGESATISWTVQNDGTASTPNGAVWYDRIWLSLEPKVSSSGVIPTLLGTFPNVSALAPGESYTQTETVELPTQITGDYYLFVTTDAYSADPIYWEDGVEVPYNPPAYLAALSYGCNGYDCGNYAGNRIFEISEYDHYSNYPYYHDNFFYVQTEVTVPKYPDLRVMYISPMPQNSFSGQPLNISFHVSNEGDYDTRVPYWTDVVFASNHDVFDQAAIPIKTISHHGLLMKDSSYVVNTIINLPMTMEGQVWLFVHTDYYNQVNEHVGILNNVTRSDSINVILVPPADLVPQNILADNMVSTGANFHFSYEIHNQGAGEPDHNSWVDRCYLSADTNDLTNAIQIAGDNHFNGLSVNGFYPISHTMVLPSSVTEGTYYLYVHADAENNVFEYTLDNNNIVRFDQPITVVQPDLQMLTLNVEDTLHAGAEASVSYILANTGNGAVINQNVTDGFFLSQMPDGVNAIELPSFTYNSWLDAHDSVLKYQNVMLPGDLQDGVYFLFARTNVNNMVNEANTNNNRSPIRKVYVNHQQLPDLVVTSVSLPDTISVGFPVTFTANLTNQGETAAALNNLAFRLSAVTDSNSINCSVVNVTADTQSLTVGSVTTVTLIAIVSPAVVSNPASFVLTVNPNHSISESNYSNNGYSFSQTLQLYPFDLMASQLSSPNASISGQYISVSWHVDNIGTVPSETQPMFMRQDTTYLLVNDEHLPLPWFDKVYLSQDSLFDDSDVLIGDRAQQNIVYAGDGYSAGINCLIPVASDGNYYVIVVSDATNVTFDSQRANNVVARPISIIQSPLPDLQMDSLVVTNSLTTGVTYQIRYSVSNNGEHITHGDRWTDALYLNYQPTLEDAVLLGSKIHYGQLDVNAQYTATLSVNIPNIWVGEAYLMGYTDVTDQIVEMNSESNNLFVLPVSISRPLSSDLTVFAPDFPQSAVVGEDIQVSWSLQNIGLNTAQGLIKDAVYLSTDSTWSNDDILLGTVQYDINLAPSSQQQQIDTLTLQGVPIGDYYVVMRTNILNALNEDSYTNNKAVSLMTMHVDYPSLYIDQEEQLQLNSGQSVYYKLEVGPMYEHQTLSCKLTTQSTNVANKLYIAYSSAPSASNFDWSATLPYEHNQEILIPSLEQGVYYIMASGQTSDNSSQSASLLASIVHFEILSIYPYEGENIGSVTAKVIGAQFDTVMDFRLVNNNYYLPAEKVIFSNSTESYVTFNLLNQSLGDYDLEAELPGGVITVKEHAFRVVPPSSNVPTALQSMFVCVDMVRVGSLFTVDVEYKNEGTTDLNVLGFVVSSNGFPITDGSGEWSDTELYLEAEEGEVIPPGHYATKTIIVWAIQTGDIVLKLYPVRRRY